MEVSEGYTAATFEELAMPLFDQLYNFAHWLTQNPSEAEDLVQETYVKALKGFSSFQPHTNFRAWIYRILRNTFLSSRAGLRARSTVPLDEEEGPEIPHPRARRRVSSSNTPRSNCCRARLSNFRCIFVKSCCSVMWKKCHIKKSRTRSPSPSAR